MILVRPSHATINRFLTVDELFRGHLDGAQLFH
jgi:hypothetical protein